MTRRAPSRAWPLVVAIPLLTVALAVLTPQMASAATPAFVQARANEITSGTTNGLAFSSANRAGDLIAVYVLWNNTGTASVSDTRGNVYAPATARLNWGSGWSAQVFYAKNISAGANTVRATFATPITGWGVVYLKEYSGLDKVNPLDVTAGAIGTAATMNSATVTTTSPNDLLFAAGASRATVDAGGSGYTTRSTAFGNRVQDRVVTTTGSYSATAHQNSNAWALQLVAFRAEPTAPDTTPPSVPTGLTANAASTTQVNLGWTASTDNVGVAGYRVYRDGTQVATATGTTYQDNGLAPATTYSYTVAASDAAGNVSAPSVAATATTPTPPPPDTSAPTVTVTAPAQGSTVAGTTPLSANVTDDVAVAGVQFTADGSNVGAEDTTAPYAVSWDTTGVGNGPHTVTARARDAAGDATSSAGVGVTVSNVVAPPAGPVAAYAFNEGSGTAAADASGHGLSGTLVNGPTWTTGKYGGAVDLDGINDHVNLGNPAALQLTSSMTVSGWVYSTAFPGDDAAIVSKRGGTGFQLDTTVDTGPRAIGFKLTNSAGGDMFRYGATAMQLNTWYHVAGVYDATARTMNVYLNGMLDNGGLVGTITASQQNPATDVLIGQRSGGGFQFHGHVDDVRIYNRALSAAEIAADMNTGLGGSTSADPTPPTVAITAPVNSAQVTDIVPVAVDAADNVGVTNVQLFLDGNALADPDTEAPYGLAWDTRTTVNGGHTLTAIAHDAAGNSTTSAPVAVNVANTNAFQNEVLATGFDLPTAIKFLPDGRMLVVELEGTVRVLPPPYTTPDPTPFLQLTNVGSAGVQQGIYDIALDPDFATNHYFYVFYTLGTPNRDRLSRFTANSALTGTVAGSELVLYQDPQNANAEHHGGAINFGNDGKLYFTTGEHFDAGVAQSLSSPRGKIHRINPDGTVPTDNPFYDGAGPHVDSIWAYGLRNPYRAYFDGPTNRLFVGEVGGNDYATAVEEVEVGAAGANYGWPNFEGPCSAPCTSPIYSYPHQGRDSAVTGGFVYHGTQFPSSYQGSYFFADYTENWIRRLTFDANGNVTGVSNFEPTDGSVDGPYGDIVYLTEGPDGALYYVDLGYSDISATFGVSKIRRIRYTQSNQAPVASAAANPTTGPAPLAVSFSSAGSIDPEGQPITYAWTFGDGATSTVADPTHTYAQAGQYTARLTVSDGVNTTVSTPITIRAGTVPSATILAPTDGHFFVAGDVISFSGDGSDPEDGALPASAFTWNIDFLHEGHVHPGVPQQGVKSGSFTIPTTGHDFSGNTRYRITLTVTDSTGLADTKSVVVWPTKVNLNFASSPPGLTLYLDGIAKTTPFVYDTLAGFNHVVEARNQSAPGVTYSFASWSDGGAQQHTITLPATATSYTATYTTSSTPATIAFQQANSATPQAPQSTVVVPYLSAQTAGDTNIVAIGWNSDTGSITSVSDGAGNTYQVAAPVARGPGLSQAIYYAKNVNAAAAGANSVTVTFSAAMPWVDVRVAEYGGLDPASPLDSTASAAGSTATANSGNVTTIAPTTLLFGAGMTVGAYTAGGAGYTTRVITTPDADIVLDRTVTATGTYNVTASQGGAAPWVMQLAAFRAAGQ